MICLISLFGKGSGTSLPNDVSRKMLLSYAIIRPNFIVGLPLLLEIFGNMYIAIVCIVCFPGCGVMNFGINLVFLFKLFLYLGKTFSHKYKYLENKKSFLGETKMIFHHFKGLSVVKSCFKPESAPVRYINILY